MLHKVSMGLNGQSAHPTLVQGTPRGPEEGCGWDASKNEEGFDITVVSLT